MIRLYGVDKGESSWPRVTHGVRAGLDESGALASFYDVARVDHEYDSDALDEGYDAPVGLCVGPPLSASIMAGRGDHRERLLMIATNSSWLPHVVMERASKIVTGYIGTSSWASSVIKNYAHGLPVYTWPHGVDPGFQPPEDYEPGIVRRGVRRFSVLHLASTHMERKGTRELIEAWALAKKHGSLGEHAILRLVVDGPRGYFLGPIHEACKDDPDLCDSYILETRRDLDVTEMRDFYCEHHVICQPSRAEGFGLVPLEARACGVPIIATACTGHADHIEVDMPGVIVVPHGADAPVDDGPGALAPTVEPEDIAQALSECRDRWVDYAVGAASAAAEIPDRWSWKATTQAFFDTHGGDIGLTLMPP